MNISVALATYNGARHLREQLDSLARQTLRPGELVVRDDGSTDDTLAIVEDFARTAPFPVRAQRNAVNLGWGPNFLSAALACRGEVVAFCDQDDLWQPAKLARYAEAIAGRQAGKQRPHEAVRQDDGPVGQVVRHAVPGDRLGSGQRADKETVRCIEQRIGQRGD